MKFDLHNTHERKPFTTKTSVESVESSPIEYTGTDLFQDRYVLRTQASVEFWSNKAQLSEKVAHAEKLALSYIFQDMLPLVEQIMLTANDEDTMRTANKLKNMMLGEDR